MNRYSRELPLLKVGREVLFVKTDDTDVRCGEGAFIRRTDGAILHVYTRFSGGDIKDHGKANLAAVISYDLGETWEDHGVILPCPEDAVNLMSVSCLRLPDDEILLFYMKKTLENGTIICRPHVRSSFDECESFGEERCLVEKDTRYYILNNDRVIQLSSGRILVPLAFRDTAGEKAPEGAHVVYLASDSGGKTWDRLPTEHQMPFENLRGFEEPGLYQHEDGLVWGYYRTNIGCQFETVSSDGGETWSTPKPNVFFTGARSPMLVKKACGFTCAVFNPISLYTGRNLGGIRGRAPFLLAVSDTDGATRDEKSFTRLFFLEDDMDNDYSYPAILDLGDAMLVAYYHSDGRARPLNRLKIVKVKKEELISAE